MWIILAYAVGVLTGGSAVWLIAYYLGMKAAWEEMDGREER